MIKGLNSGPGKSLKIHALNFSFSSLHLFIYSYLCCVYRFFFRVFKIVQEFNLGIGLFDIVGIAYLFFIS